MFNRFGFTILFLYLFFASPTVADPVNAVNAKKSQLINILSNTEIDFSSRKIATYQILVRSAALGCPRDNETEYMITLLKNGLADDGGDVFVLPPLVRFINQFRHCISDRQLNELKLSLLNSMPLFEHGTLNHAVMFASSWYLLSQYFPEIVWKDKYNRYFSAENLQKQISVNYKSRVRGIYQSGYQEQFSPTYAMVNLMAVLNIVDFSTDTSMRAAAESEAIFIVSALRAIEFNGILVPPLNRAHLPQCAVEGGKTGNPPAVSQQIIWLYFGGNNCILDNIKDRREPFFVTILALSSWMPPRNLFDVNSRVGEIRSIIPGFSKWGGSVHGEVFGQSTISSEFAIGVGNLNFQAAGYHEAVNSFAIYLKNKDEFRLFDCYHPFWLSDIGESKWLGDRSSPFVQTVLFGNSGVLLFDIPKVDPYFNDSPPSVFQRKRKDHKTKLIQHVSCRFPVSGIDELIMREDSFFVRFGSVSLVVISNGTNIAYRNLGFSDGMYKEFFTQNSHGALFFKVDTGAGSGEEIISAAKEGFSYRSGSASISTSTGERLVSFKSPQNVGKYLKSIPEVDGSPLFLSNEKIFINSEFIKIGDGRIEYFNDSGLIYRHAFN